LFLVVVGFIVSGCSQPPKPMRFNNMIAQANSELGEAAKKFKKAVEPLGNGQPADAGARTAYNEIKSLLEALKKKFDKMKPPVNSPSGEALLEKYREFLENQQEIFDQFFTPMMAAVDNNALSPADKWSEIQPKFAQITQKEDPVRNTLLKLQDDYAKSHNLEPQKN
jgi:hypothetical protein